MKFRCKPSKLDDAKHIYAKNQSINNMTEAYIYMNHICCQHMYIQSIDKNQCMHKF